MKSQTTIKLGALGLQVAFTIPGSETIYRTITYGPSSANPWQGSRECLNLATMKAEKISCNKEVCHVEHK